MTPTLLQKHIDSQMAHIDTFGDDNALPNIAPGFIAAAGGVPFTTEDSMPGDADLFIGIRRLEPVYYTLVSCSIFSSLSPEPSDSKSPASPLLNTNNTTAALIPRVGIR